MADTPSAANAAPGRAPPFGLDRRSWTAPLVPTLPHAVAPAMIGNPDHDLIRRCAEHLACLEAVKASPDEEEDGPAWCAYESNRDAISAAQPQTLAGLIAKARAAKLEATFWDSFENIHDTMAEPWAWDLVNALLRLAGEG
ncbi:hypothetical protein EAH89_29015 [Roseomonas nepalensis]|uniref:Uncharacterized protein n=1 Tax=Muricoccus nepalensis TaxID=1854500 RepID=A0A502ETR0_9PROT|nr:hypothetical protein [Roseomonas nepalensis]TPG39910.1 hypothetical protein EAH89_29015 [Roseomonas nepalensis]